MRMRLWMLSSNKRRKTPNLAELAYQEEGEHAWWIITWFQSHFNQSHIHLWSFSLLQASVLQGFFRGGSGSARHFVAMLVEAVIAIVSMFIAWKGVQLISPLIQTWLKGQNLQIPSVEISALKQAYYTVITSLRDFPLLRFGVLFMLGYVIIKQILNHADWPLDWALAGRTRFHIANQQ